MAETTKLVPKTEVIKVSYALLHDPVFIPGVQGGTQHGPKFMSTANAGQRAYRMWLENVKDQGFLVVATESAKDFYIPLIQVKGLTLE